jgi:hypothetical protein
MTLALDRPSICDLAHIKGAAATATSRFCVDRNLQAGAPDPAKMKETMPRYGLIPAPPAWNENGLSAVGTALRPCQSYLVSIAHRHNFYKTPGGE